ncbi:PREDICTED: tumor necrosis factor receptor superfamily member 18 [Buceros rhinoceros silvestris]|uniref:tumor necrosis factor receptor superfamily member 18 n=1 Tax=Buceros rhinoceros silvestris TaxID=175836 RepID=UPI00052936B9|nr:PREDICTED: tumor necrosis factor receptor superfamily member 18 [Buceros rhinoceros silvestris]
MTKQTREGSYLKIRACLLLLAWQWAQQALATPCPSGELRIITKDERKCCPKCNPYAGDNSMCQNATGACKCRQGYACADRDCLYCKKLPECAEGEELVKIGSLDFAFKCQPCKKGTYSNVKNGWCRDWTDCEASGFLTREQGNRTHNSVCGFPPKDVDQVPIANPPLYTTVLAILTAVAIFVLILLTFFLHFCMWSLKNKKYYMAEDLEHNFPRPLAAPQLSQHREETYSCQFPEEEHGGKTAEEKHCYSCPQSLQGQQIY